MNTSEHYHRETSDSPQLRMLLIVPAYNEEKNVPLFVQTAAQELQAYDWQVLFVDDGSRDGTWEAVSRLADADKRVHGLRFARNFGHQNALKAGLLKAGRTNADLYITLDADLQHPLSLIPVMVEEWQKGAVSIVQAQRDDADRSISLFKKWTSGAFYGVFSWLSGVPMRPGMSDFRLIDRDCMEFLSSFDEQDFFLRGLLPWSGLKTAFIPYKPAERIHGQSKFTLKKMGALAMSGIVGYSTRPLYLALVVGLFSILVACAYLCYVIVVVCLGGTVSLGWPSIISTILGLGGIQLFVMGIMGIYLGKMFMENKNRPTFVIEEKV